ncbi:MAG TPA: hypothetical protein VK766_03740, partial [Cytophagaceae bacterium]|nr:hypothetical protein [Cytophagaceae bacterium]
MKKIVLLLIILFQVLVHNIIIAGTPTPSINSVQPEGGGAALSSACKGQTVRLVGVNFAAPDLLYNMVTINGVNQLSYTFINSDTIEFIIPSS